MATQTFTIFTPTIWSARINWFLRNKLAAAKFFDDYSGDAVNGGSTINIPSIADGFTMASITVTTGDVSGTSISDTKTSLSVDTWSGAALIFSDFQLSQVQGNYRLKEAYAQAMGYAGAKTLDSAIIRLAASTSITTVGNTSTALLATTIEKAMAILSSRSVPMEECAFIMHPNTYYRRIFNVSKYYDASQYGKPSIQFGRIDALYGVPVIVTQQITTCTYAAETNSAGNGYRNLLAHKSTFVWALANIPGQNIEGVRISELKGESLRTKVVCDIAYGVKLLNASRAIRVIDKKG